MNKKHAFNLDGGYTLSKMGASWFVSYSYYLLVDNSHKNWSNCETIKMRQSFFRNSTRYHDAWLNNVLKMNPRRLDSNLLHLNGNDVIKMAQAIISKQQGV